MKKTVIVIVFILLSITRVNAAGEASISKEKHDDIMKLLELFTVTSDCDKFLDMAFNGMKEAYPEIPIMELTQLRKTYFDRKPYLEKGVEIYARHFSHNEIREMIAFYSSPVGKKLSTTRGEMIIEIRQAFQTLGEELMQKVTAELRRKGYVKESKDELTN